MLRVTLDVNGRVIGRMEIVNRGPSQPGDEDDPAGWRRYTATVYTENQTSAGTRVVHHARRDGAWALVYKCSEVWHRGGL